jgi:hypothetical protein
MALLRLKYSGNVYDAAPAGTVDFPLVTPTGANIPYLQRTHIHVYKSSDKGVTWVELTRPTDWDFDSTGTIARLKAAVTPDYVMVRRITPYQELYTKFQDSSLLTADQLNEGEKFSMYVDQELYDLSAQGFQGQPGQIITTPDQKKPDATGLKSGGWVSDDDHIATTGAISERLDVYVQDTKPPDPPITEIRQPGKLWIDDGALQLSYWEPNAQAWVNLGSTGPKGDKGDSATVAVGTTTTGAPGSAASVTNSGTTSAAILDFVVPQGPQGVVGAAGPAGPAGPMGPLPSITGHAPVTSTTTGSNVDLTFDPIPLTYLP